MNCCVLFHVCVATLILFSFGFCMKFDDIITDDEHSEIKNNLEENLAALERQIIEESVEIREWQERVRVLEKHLNDARADKIDVLRRQKRGLKDPRLRMFVGKPGAPGRPGKPGRPGAVGRRGEKGHKGVAGSIGLRGPPGPFGPPGWQGPPGFIGEAGIKGKKGIAGFDGIPGLIGDVGYVGYNGEHGRMGPPGVLGHIGFIGMTGHPGPRGDMGVFGNLGLTGEKGSLGVPGPVGLYGEPGEMGESGFMGPPGHIGYKGKKGDIGMSGDNGQWGPVGRPGPVYDPYAGMIAPGPIIAKLGGGPQVENCTDTDENATKCSTYGEKQLAPAFPYQSKSLPAFYHPPPGAHVMPAQPKTGKSSMVHGPSVYGKHSLGSSDYGKQYFGPPVIKQYLSPNGQGIEFNDDEKDILNEQEYLKTLDSNRVQGEESEANFKPDLSEESLDHADQSSDNSSEETDSSESSEEIDPLKSAEEIQEELSEKAKNDSSEGTTSESDEATSESEEESEMSAEVNRLNATDISLEMEDIP